jgi:hypothetical protein
MDYVAKNCARQEREGWKARMKAATMKDESVVMLVEPLN